MADAARSLGLDARIVVAGAGSIGCFIGGLLACAGRRVTFLGRPRVIEELKAHGLRLTGLTGFGERLAADSLDLAADAAVLRDADLVLVTVKSGNTSAVAREIAEHCSKDVTVLSLQNGVGNVSALRSPSERPNVFGGIVEFNVIHKGTSHFHQGTSGGVVIEAGRDDLRAIFSVPHLHIETTTDLTSLQWGKLLLNLNNALNALSGLPLREQLQNREWRRLLADQTEEALRVTREAGITPAALPVPPRLIPALLRMPNGVFRLVARQALTIDPEARSSMWEDLVKRRPTEIDYLQGEVVALGARSGVATPVCAAIIALIRRAETMASGSPRMTPQEVRKAVSI